MDVEDTKRIDGYHDNTFVCAHCKEEFKTNMADKKRAVEESNSLWGDLKPENADVVCGACFVKVMECVEKVGGNA